MLPCSYVSNSNKRISGLFLRPLTHVAVTMNRVVMQDYTFKCLGLSLPKGTLTSAAAGAVATDDRFFKDPFSFDSHRYLRLREQHKESESSLVMGMSRIDSLGFGLGNQACPGRFFAVNNIKLLMAKLLIGWDLTLEKNGKPFMGETPEVSWKDLMIVSPSEFSIRLNKT